MRRRDNRCEIGKRFLEVGIKFIEIINFLSWAKLPLRPLSKIAISSM